MASKEKVKKKFKNAPPKKITPHISGSLIEAKDKDVVHEEEDLPSGLSEENTKDTGHEKQRSDTPSPPPVVSSPQKKKRIPSPHSTQKRSSSPFSQNKVEPLPSGSKDLSNPGSVISLRSNTSVKEAWTDNEEDKSRPGSSQEKNKVAKNSRGSTQIDAVSIKSASPEQNAYIPYLYAKGCIARITDDMKSMKDNHIRIVHDIEAHYRSLEGESQKQFMAFVLKYRENFQGRLVSFQHMIQHFRDEMSMKDEKSREEIVSLRDQNSKLLQEKNEALTHSKDEIAKLETEKVTLASQITGTGAGAAALAKLQEENEALKEENSQLKAHGPSQTSDVSSTNVNVLAAVPVPVRDGDEEERGKWKDHVLKLQEEVTLLKTDNGQLVATNEAFKQQLSQSSGLAERFAALESQYKALCVVLVPNAETKTAAEEQLSKTKEEKVMMEDEQKRLDKEIKNWEKAFVKENGRQPTEADKSDSVKELYVQQGEVNQMVTSLDQQRETLTQLTSGNVPPPPEAGAAVAVTEPEVQVVEVTVPDPEIVTQLEASQNEVDELKSQIIILSAAGGASASSLGDEEKVDQAELDASNAALLQEQAAHDNTKTELENVQRQLEMLNDTLKTERSEIESKMEAYKSTLEAKIASRDEQIASLKNRKDELEEERLKDVPLDTAKEIKNLQNKIAVLEQDKSTLSLAQAGETAKISELTRKLQLSDESLQKEKDKQKQLEERLKVAKKEKDDAVRDLTKILSTRAPGRPTRQKTQMGDAPTGRGDVASLKRENQELNARIKQLEKESFGGGGVVLAGVSDKKTQLRNEKILKELEKRYDMERNKNAKLSENFKEKESEAASLQKSNNQKEAEIAKLTAELSALGVAAKEGVAAAGKLKELEKDNKMLAGENKTLAENFNSERVLRKKYYNMVEDMKGKIRVYCRARPLSRTEKDRGNFSVLNSVDEYTLSVNSSRGVKEFQFDQVFMENSSQEQIFEDTNNLIQSAIDGYNVCIFAYGQTGSGKTFTMIGDSSRQFPGIAPRAFQRIFDMAEENKSKIDMSVSVYMMELYNDKLIDLFAKAAYADEDRMEIKKDKKGMVFVHGAMIKSASNAKELNALFEEGSLNRHTAATKMNAESSRSHLILSIVMESTNKATGTVMKGKLSLVDLAGSERVGKTGANAEQLKEAMSINKSLSALGDVISALSSEQSFIPYRNNKLTMLMQDSLGGNAKTLMFVNISPADYNVDESVISLTYASRVKLITNDASKNADNKEITRLKNIISKMKKGEAVDEEAE